MTIFKETVEEELVTTAEAKELLADVEAERAADEERELRYELARAIEHANRFALLGAEESRELVDELLELQQEDGDRGEDHGPPAADQERAPVRVRTGTVRTR